jgi:hypothetical protein
MCKLDVGIATVERTVRPLRDQNQRKSYKTWPSPDGKAQIPSLFPLAEAYSFRPTASGTVLSCLLHLRADVQG